MHTTPLIQALRTRCPLFSNRVAGALEFDALRESNAAASPAAFVIATGDTPTDNRLQTGVYQPITDTFGVVVLFKNSGERGQAVGDQVHAVRAMLLRALVNWTPQPNYEPIEYQGCDLIEIDRARVFYRFSFSGEWVLGGTDEVWREHLTDLESVMLDLNPTADPNAYPSSLTINVKAPS